MRHLVILLTGMLIWVVACQSPKREEKIDHIILVVNDLERGIAQFKELTGIEPVFGGIHPNSFTQNALVALDHQAYIEILAPRTDIDSIPEWIQQFENLTPGGWAVTTADVAKTQRKLTDLGFTVTETRSGSRAKPDGGMLSWTTFGIKDKDTTVYPFFIQWGAGTVHPSVSSSAGCSLVMLQLASNDSNQLQVMSDELKLGLSIEAGTESKITLRISTPKGEVTFPAGGN